MRRVLLVLVAAGVLLMHTLGHPSTDHALRSGGQPAHTAGMVRSELPVALPHDGGLGMHFDPTDVCLAVVVGALILLLAVLLAATSHQAAGHDVRRPLPARPSRAPPVSPFGLRLADLSVLRT